MLAHVFQVREEFLIEKAHPDPTVCGCSDRSGQITLLLVPSSLWKDSWQRCRDSVRKDVVENKTTWGTGQGKHVFLLFPSRKKLLDYDFFFLKNELDVCS